MPESPTLEIPAAPAASPVAAPSSGADNKPDKFEVPETVQRLMKNLGMGDGDAAPAADTPVKPKADDKPAGDPKPKVGADSKPPAVPADDKPVGVRREKIERPQLPVIEPAKPKAPVGDPVAEFKPDPQWESTLEESEREILDDAREAEKLFPDKYKGLAARTAKFIKEHADLTTKEEFDDQDPKYRAWLDQHQPKLTRKEIRDIETARATSHVKQEYDGRLTDIQHKMYVREQEPRLQEEGKTIFAELTHLGVPEELAKEITTNGLEKARELYGLEIDTAQAVISVATDDLVEFKRITMKDPETGRPLQPIMERAPTGNPDDPAFQREMHRFEQHKRLGQLVDFLCDDFKRSAPAKDQMRNGRWYVTRDEMTRIRPERRHEFWTFTNVELIDRAKQNVPLSVKQAITTRREQMQKIGWQPPAARVAAPAKPKDTPAPLPTNTPRLPAATPVPDGGDPMADIDARAKRMALQLNRE